MVVRFGTWLALQPPLYACCLSLVAGIHAAWPVAIDLSVYTAWVVFRVSPT
jgi:hypothetical protein